MSSARAAAGRRSRRLPERPRFAATRPAELARTPPVPFGRRLSIVRGALAPPFAVGGTTRRPVRRESAVRTSAAGDRPRVHRIEDARRRIDPVPVDATRVLLEEARTKWLEAAVAVARLLGHARPAAAGGGAEAVDASRWRSHDTRPATRARRPPEAERGGVEAIAWFGEAR
jgi:hypothetical protein